MALQVTDFGQWAQATSAPAIGTLAGNAFSFSGLYRFTTADGGTILGVGSSTSSQYVALGMTAAGLGFFEIGAADAFAPGNFAANAWHSLVGVQANSTSRVFYADGAAGTVNATSASPSTASLDRTTIGALMVNGGTISTANGDIAECAIWDVALTADEAAMLAARVCPLLVRPNRLVFYCPAQGHPSAEFDLIGGRVLTWDGFSATLPVVAPHPAVLMPPSGPAVPPTSETTHVTSSWATSWVTQARASSSWSTTYITRMRAAADWSTGWTVRTRPTGAWATSYVTRTRATSSWQTSWVTRARASSTWSTGWGTSARGLATWATSYAVNAHPTVTWSTSWTVANPLLTFAATSSRTSRLVVGRAPAGSLGVTHG